MCYREFCIVLIFNLSVVQTTALAEVILCQNTFLYELVASSEVLTRSVFHETVLIGTNYVPILYFFSTFMLHQLFCDFSESGSSSKQTIIIWVISSTLYKICYNRQLQLFFLSIMFYKYSLRSPYRMEGTVLCSMSLKKTRIAGHGTACPTQGRVPAIHMQSLTITYFSHDRVHTDDATGKVTASLNSSLLH